MADECVTALPPFPSGKYRRTTARLYTLVGKTAGRASTALERSDSAYALTSGGYASKYLRSSSSISADSGSIAVRSR